VLIYIKKEQALDDVERRYPAKSFLQTTSCILTAVKQLWGGRVTSVVLRQGTYARGYESDQRFPPADVTIECIKDLLDSDFPQPGTTSRSLRPA